MGDAGDRTRFWPAIEKKHDQPMAHWFAVMAAMEGRTYDEQIALQHHSGTSPS